MSTSGWRRSITVMALAVMATAAAGAIPANATPSLPGRTFIGSGWNIYNRVVAADVNGDGWVDILATEPNGDLWVYYNSELPWAWYPSQTFIGPGWNIYNRIGATQVAGAYHADILATKPDGTLWQYHNSLTTIPYSSGTLVGPGWNIYNRVVPTDVSGDGCSDILATKADGTLWYYACDPNAVPSWNTGRLIGSGWQDFNRIAAGPMFGDPATYTDIVATKPDGTMWLYRNEQQTAPYDQGWLLSSGWNSYSRFVVGDVDGDSRADILAWEPNGNLWVYYNINS